MVNMDDIEDFNGMWNNMIKTYNHNAKKFVRVMEPAKKTDKAPGIIFDSVSSEFDYVRVPENHIVIDFDLKDENGNKSFEKNLEAASKFPKTYAELSKSGAGIHLHYIYDGDVQELSRSYDKDIFHGVSNIISATNKGVRSNAQSIKMLRKQLRKSRFGTGLAIGGVILLASAVNTLCEKVQELNGKVAKLETEKHEDDLK